MYLIYSQFVYLLPPDLMRGLRLLSVIVVAISLVRLIPKSDRNEQRKLYVTWILALFFANYTLFFGLQFPSFQELTGVTFIAIGLLSKNQIWRFTWFLLTALTKELFIPLLVLYGVYLLLQRMKALGAISIITGLLLGTPVVIYSPAGYYTQSAFALNPWHLWSNVQSLASTGALSMFISLIGLVALRSRVRFNAESLVFLTAAGAYGLGLLFWWAGGYYTSPVWYLLSVGLALAYAPASSETTQNLDAKGNRVSSFAAGAAIASCLIASMALFLETLRADVIGWNRTYVEARDWVLAESRQGSTYFLYDLNPTEFDFYLKEKDPRWDLGPSPYWQARQPRPANTLGTDYVIASTVVGVPEEITQCEPIKVWTKGFLAPTKC
jgi:hypothetical protein